MLTSSESKHPERKDCNEEIYFNWASLNGHVVLVEAGKFILTNSILIKLIIERELNINSLSTYDQLGFGFSDRI